MADFSITVNNSLNVFGIDNTDNWGTMLWGEKWGYGSNDLTVAVLKVIENSLSSDNSVSFGFSKVISEALALTGDMTDESLRDAAGYEYIFGVDTNAENRPLTSYSQGSNTSSSYTRQTTPSTTWTEAP